MTPSLADLVYNRLRKCRVAALPSPFRLLVALGLALVGGLSSLQAEHANLMTGRVLSIAEIRSMTHVETYVGDDTYAVVDSASLETIQRDFLRDVRVSGSVVDNPDGDLSGAYVAAAQMAFVVKNWHNRTKAKALAVGEAWLNDHGSGEARAIVVAITEKGLVFWDPAKACEINLGPRERSSLVLCRI